MSTLSTLLSDFFRTSERGVFWDHDKRANMDPLEGLSNGFWDAVWDLKVRSRCEALGVGVDASVTAQDFAPTGGTPTHPFIAD
jgi:hypothetical protein